MSGYDFTKQEIKTLISLVDDCLYDAPHDMEYQKIMDKLKKLDVKNKQSNQ